MTADATALALPPTDGVYLMGVHVLEDGVRVAVGRSRVFVPVLSRAPSISTKVATLVAMTTRPSLLGPGLLADDHLAAEVAPGGRLRVLFEAAQRRNASYAVDPALVAELETMRAGYLVRNPDGTTRAGAGQADAAWWLNSLTQLSATHDGYRLLFAAPDVAALAHTRDTAALKAAAAAGQRNALTADLPLIVLPTGGAADRATLKAAAALRPRAVLLSDRTTKGAGPVLDSGASTPVLSYVAGGLGGGPGPDPQADAVHTHQRAIATSWVNLADPTGRAAQVHLVQTPDDVASTSTTDTAWSVQVPLADVLRQPPARWSGILSYPQSARRAELGKSQLVESRHITTAARTWADLLVDGEQARAEADATSARSLSGTWRGQQPARAAYLRPQQRGLDLRLEQVQISTIARATTTAQEGISFPITVRNNLTPQTKGGGHDPMAIHVDLRFTSANSARLKVATLDADAVAPDGAYTANAKVTAKANGTVPVTAQLYTPHGYKIGRAAPIEVHVTQNGTTGWAISVVAGVVLIGSTTWRIRKVGQEKARSLAPTAPATPALASVASNQLGGNDDDAAIGS